MTTKNLWWKTHENKFNLLRCHLHEQVDKSNKLVDLFVKLKCQFHILGSVKNIYSQTRAGWVFLKEAWQMLWKCTAKESNLPVFTQLFCWRTPCSSHGMPESLFSSLKQSLSSRGRLTEAYSPSCSFFQQHAWLWHSFGNTARSQMEGSFCGERAMGNSLVAFNQISWCNTLQLEI